MKIVTVAIDAMGGDNAPIEIIKGSILALQENNNLKIVLIGKKEIIEKELFKYKYDENKIKIIHASEVISTDEQPTIAIKTKKDSSIIVGLKLLKQGEVDSFVSAGSTGAILAAATIIVGRIKGIERPALGTLLPTEKNFTFLIDSGANVDSKPIYLEQFAKMGSLYMEYILGIKNPKIGLVNVGVEKEKGNSLTKEAYELLEKSKINFIGNIEARDIPLGDVDVLVCDAFVGNIILKFAEGAGRGILNIIKKEITSGIVTKIGGLLAISAFKRVKKRFDYSEIGGAPFLGLKGLVVKAHGNSDGRGFKGAINQCVKFSEQDIITKISNMI